METRRDFLQMTLAAAALPGIAGAMAATARASSPATVPAAPITTATQSNGPPLELYKVIYDERFPTSRAFAQQVKRAGVTIRAIQGDVTSVWFNDLNIRWKQSPAAIAGLTAASALFCLERLAWDHGMRCVFHEEHALDGHESGWVHPIADLLSRFPRERAIAGAATRVWLPRVSHSTSRMEPSTLMSWVIAWPFRRE
jgi:hypothetical protein